MLKRVRPVACMRFSVVNKKNHDWKTGQDHVRWERHTNRPAHARNQAGLFGYREDDRDFQRDALRGGR